MPRPLLLSIVFAVAAGLATAAQPAINAMFARHTPSKLHGGFINFFVGTLAMLLVCLLVRTPLPEGPRLAQAPWWSWLGGTLGAFFVTTALILVPKMGAANYFAAMIAGQLLGTALIDHWGLLGIEQRMLTPGRIAGLVLIFMGVFLVRRF
jgi:bacterial/archaeal transporter family-2 protein